jgi:hypothetical protein
MTKKLYARLASLVAVVSALAFAGAAGAAAHHGQHRQQRDQHAAAGHVRRRAAKARKRVRRRAVSYVCPMHPDMRSKSRGECPKCGMELTAERRGARAAGKLEETAGENR